MKIDSHNKAVILSILPVFFLISGFLSLERLPITFYKIETYEILTMFIGLFAVSYLFLKDLVSVLISIGCSLNVMFGVLFFIDLFEVEYSSLLTAAIILSLGFSLLVNTILLYSVHQNKKSSETDAKLAVRQAVSVNFWTVVLSFITFLLLLVWGFQIQFVPFKDFVWVSAAGLSIAVINAFMLLPVLGSLSLGHINEERQQDDLKLSFSERILQKANDKIEKGITALVKAVSVVLTHKIISTLTAILVTACLVLELTIENAEDYYFMILGLVYFLFIVMRYKSYILASAPFLSLIFSYFLLSYVCKILVWNSESLMQISFFGGITIAAIAAFLQTDTAFGYYKNASKTQDAVVNATAKTFFMVLASGLVMVIFLILAVHFNDLHKESFQDLMVMGTFIIGSSVLTLFPGTALLKTAFSCYESFRKPNKKRIKSVYM